MSTDDTATPESSAAESTSEGRRKVNITQVTRELTVGLTVVLGPPAEVSPSDDVVKHEADNSRRDKVDRSCRWDAGSTREDDGHVDILNPGVGEVFCEEVRNRRCNSTDEEEVY
jgi:hypothetical protein